MSATCNDEQQKLLGRNSELEVECREEADEEARNEPAKVSAALDMNQRCEKCIDATSDCYYSVRARPDYRSSDSCR